MLASSETPPSPATGASSRPEDTAGGWPEGRKPGRYFDDSRWPSDFLSFACIYICSRLAKMLSASPGAPRRLGMGVTDTLVSIPCKGKCCLSCLVLIDRRAMYCGQE